MVRHGSDAQIALPACLQDRVHRLVYSELLIAGVVASHHHLDCGLFLAVAPPSVLSYSRVDCAVLLQFLPGAALRLSAGD